MESIHALIRQLVDIPSVTGQEGEIGRFLARHLTQRGYRVHLQEIEADRFNVYALPEQTPWLVFCTHLDTVPPFFPSSEDELFIHGRGACDAKGIVAAMIQAAARLRGAGVPGVGLLFVAGEEVDNCGARIASRLAPTSRYVIVGEPTDNLQATGHKGSLEFRLRAEGRVAHSAYPERGDSAIHRLLEALARIRAASWGHDDTLGAATVNVGMLAGGIAANVLAPSATAVVLVRVVGTADDAEGRLRALLAADGALSYELITRSDAVRCHVVPDLPRCSVAFGTDIPFLRSFGRPLLFGPGSIHDAHGDSERIAKNEVLRAVDSYCELAKKLQS